ncbi:MAG: hypothetical protein R2712_02595 [Vicinamibacterales bacterium]
MPLIGSLRAEADHSALRRRFHDPALHTEIRPLHLAAAGLFDALEQARLDALGAGWLAGVAHNLLTYPGMDDDGVRWLVFETVSGHTPPAGKAALVARAGAALGGPLVDALTSLALAGCQPVGLCRARGGLVRTGGCYGACGGDVRHRAPVRHSDRTNGWTSAAGATRCRGGRGRPHQQTRSPARPPRRRHPIAIPWRR